MSLLDQTPKTPYAVVGVQFSGGNRTYYYRAPTSMGVEPGDRVVTVKGPSFSIPTVVGVYPVDCSMAEEATDWLVQKIDTRAYEAVKREYAL